MIHSLSVQIESRTLSVSVSYSTGERTAVCLYIRVYVGQALASVELGEGVVAKEAPWDFPFPVQRGSGEMWSWADGVCSKDVNNEVYLYRRACTLV